MKNKKGLVLAISIICCFAMGLSGCSQVKGLLSQGKDNNTAKEEETEVKEDVAEPVSEAEKTEEEITTPDEENDGVEEYVFESGELSIDSESEMYTYEQMENDLKSISHQYGTVTKLYSLANTMDGRKVYDLVIGNESAKKQYLFTASIHGREYITTQLVMKQAIEWIRAIDNGTVSATDYAIHLVPMVNPDGVTISQFGLDKINNESTKDRILEIADLDGMSANESYLSKWKANANGVDLNRNFDAKWNQYKGTEYPSSDHYKGTEIGSEPESSALINLTKQNQFTCTVSYHTQGEVIYWNFGQEGILKKNTQKLANAVSDVTGYTIDASSEGVDPAGYKDWAISKMKIPSLTIEIGRETSPVPSSQFDRIWSENKQVWSTVLGITFDKEETDKKQDKKENTSKNGEVYYINNCKEFVSLRKKADTSSKCLKEIPLGYSVEVLSTVNKNGFWKVRYNGVEGYVLSQYIGPNPPAVSNNSNPDYYCRIINCNEWVTLRETPDTSSKSLLKIPLGALVNVVSTTDYNGFWMVEYNGYVGYVLNQYIGYAGY